MSDVLVRFLDGPLVGCGNTQSLGGAYDFVFPEDRYGWPLPERLCALAHLGLSTNVAIWDPEVEESRADALPQEITHSPNAVTYRKISESPLKPGAHPRVMPGAAYRMSTESAR